MADPRPIAVLRHSGSPGPAGGAPALAEPRLARLAWEFLRRNPDYRAAYRRWKDGEGTQPARRYGLREPVDPEDWGVDAAGIWRRGPSA